MFDLLTEEVLSLAEAARRLPRLRRGRPTSPTTLWRWSRDGVSTPAGPIRLEVYSYAGQTVTTWEAVQRFLTAVAKAKAGQADAGIPLTGSSAARLSSHLAAKAKLDRSNISASDSRQQMPRTGQARPEPGKTDHIGGRSASDAA
jgi:hypothetical protein